MAQTNPVLSRLAVVWLNLWFWSLFFFWTLILALVAMPYYKLHCLLRRDLRRSKRVIRRTITHYGRAVTRSGWPLVRVKFVDQSPDDKPPFVFVANHRSTSDAFLMSVLPFECVQVLNVWTSRLPLVNYLSRWGEYLRVRELTFDQFMALGTRLLSEGVSIIAFPEGTRSGSCRLGPFHGTAFRLAQRAGVKICPMTISGSENIPRRGSLVLHPGKIVVTKLPALTCEEFMGMNPYRLKTRVRETIRQHLESQHLEPQPA